MAAVDNTSPATEQPGSGSGAGLSLAEQILRRTQYLYALVLLVTFICCAGWYSVVNSKKQEKPAESKIKGPGGKPLPSSKREKPKDGERKIGPVFGRTAKNVFRCLAAVVFLSYVASTTALVNHAFWHEDPYRWSKEGLPWAGEWTVVRCSA